MTDAVEEKSGVRVSPGRYRHYKGQDYEVLGVARHSETEEEMVVYRCLYGDFSLWVRPLAMFCEMVAVDGCLRPRFAPLTPCDGSAAVSGGGRDRLDRGGL